MAIDYSPYNEALWSNPWPTYARMQEEAPAYYIDDLDCWALSRFEDVWQASMDRASLTATHGTSTDALFLSANPPPAVFLFMDPPQHAQYRNLIARAYTKDKIATIENHVRDTVRRLMAPMLEEGRFDVYRLASRTALELIAAFIGLRLEDVLQIREYVDRFYGREPGVRGTTEAGAKAFSEAHDYIVGLIEHYRRAPPAEHSHLVAWMNAGFDGGMSVDQLFFNIFAMVITGSDTLPLSTAGCIYQLDRHPDQLAALRDDPALAAAAFEEAARFDQPTNLLGRKLVCDRSFHGETMREGQSVLLLYAAACRDEREFSEPHRFDIRRVQRRNLSFGTGIHFCLGQHLARLEGRVLLEEMLGAIDAFEVERDSCRRIVGEFLQGFNSVPIRFDPR